ncbi:MAG: phospho-N-acetylmuramoyl-pentapeptide-transferase [Alphaproteobacteria bacterium]|nr:phospho-N-acetylmuramoyl-pentapeptide-transferase [Alphaproteobacteria bacterium]
MLYTLFHTWFADASLANLFRYLTFRTIGALLTALVLSFMLGPVFIRWLKSKQRQGQPIRDDGPESHLVTKQGTPTMGGLLILSVLTLSVLLWGNLESHTLWIVLLVTLGFGALGAMDDIVKLMKFSSKGLSARGKFLGQLAVSGVASSLILYWLPSDSATHLMFPFFKNLFLDLGWFFVPFSMVVMVGASNAVNLTDGLDGLAIGPIMVVAGCFLIISYLVGNHVFATYLHIPYVAGSGELAVFCGALVGASLGFLWYNAPPAMVFMGDTGSLALGGALGSISVMTKHELVLLITGGLFVMETVSVIIQVMHFKRTGRRVFLMAPIHHHFEKKGWSEPTVVIRFWIIAIVLGLIGLSTLKLR